MLGHQEVSTPVLLDEQRRMHAVLAEFPNLQFYQASAWGLGLVLLRDARRELSKNGSVGGWVGGWVGGEELPSTQNLTCFSVT